MDAPIACTLTPGEFAGRSSDIAALSARALRSRHAIPGGARLTFANDERTQGELRDLVAAEARCCAFLQLDLRPDAGDLVLDVTGPPEALSIIEELFA
jgi:hypothetical protein